MTYNGRVGGGADRGEFKDKRCEVSAYRREDERCFEIKNQVYLHPYSGKVISIKPRPFQKHFSLALATPTSRLTGEAVERENVSDREESAREYSDAAER